MPLTHILVIYFIQLLLLLLPSFGLAKMFQKAGVSQWKGQFLDPDIMKAEYNVDISDVGQVVITGPNTYEMLLTAKAAQKMKDNEDERQWPGQRSEPFLG